MSGKVVIQVENLSKHYRLGTIGGATLREDLGRWWARVRGQPDPWARVDEVAHGNGGTEGFWALRDLNFDVREGEVLGVIGRNGAGKSTLLKLLSRITTPTTGRATIRGRVGSLLEVGTGFHPELTGRENVYLNGAILGMTRAEINRKLDEIVEFAEMSKFIDTPVKRYSSGMTVRLAFAVAAHLEPEVLIIDEVLAVGDVNFQSRCVQKMREISQTGRTLIFVSHNLSLVQSLCTRSILLDAGTLDFSGPTLAAVTRFQRISGLSEGTVRHSTKNLDLLSFEGDHSCTSMLSRIRLCATFRVAKRIDSVLVDFAVENERGVRLLQIVPGARMERGIHTSEGGIVKVNCEIHCGLLAPGPYFGVVYAHEGMSRCIFHAEQLPLFVVERNFNQPEWMSNQMTAAVSCESDYEIIGQDSSGGITNKIEYHGVQLGRETL